MKSPAPLKRRLFARSAPAKRAAPTPPPQPFHAFIAYADLSAAKRAMGAINEVLQATAGKFALKPMLWRFDQLAAAKWCDYALSDAGHASVVVLANSHAGPLPPTIEDWVGRLIGRQRGQRLTIVSLQGADDAWTISVEAPHAQPQARLVPVEKPLAALAA